MFDYEELAKQTAKNTRISTKENPGIEKAKKKFGKQFVERLLKMKELDMKQFSKKEQKTINKLMDLDYGPLVYQGVSGKYKIKTKVGETVLIAYSETDERCVRLAKELRNECWRLGCAVSMKPVNEQDSKTYYKIAPEDSLVELPPISEILSKNIDMRFFVGDTKDPNWSKGLEKKMKLSAPISMRLWQIQDKRKVRWCILGFPVEMNKKDYIVPKEKYERVYRDSIEESFSEDTVRLCNYYRKALEKGDRVIITADDGTNLSFSIKGRPVLVADGVIDEEDVKRGDIGLNIPDGETFLAPLEYSANGRVRFDYTRINGFGVFRDFWLTFKNGKVVRFEGSEEDKKKWKKFMDSNTGEKDRIAELGIGTNKKADMIGTIIVDEKIYGTIHIAIGNNTGAYHGKNVASSHQDMIKRMKGMNGKIFVDGKLVMKDGEPI
ncbi:MAG: aminopeptidase [Candidatus Aenigmarchaeota archaeon]|nr:aminopeptidase [Candidatus Aenigmarchaeota archaeon]